MARVISIEKGGISLFPMFNILVCTLGVLIFILSSVATISLGVGKSILIVPESIGGSSHLKTPTFIEWDGQNLIAYPSKTQVNFYRDLTEIETYRETYEYMDGKISNTPLGSVVDNIIVNSGTEYIIILVRPSGFDSFTEIRGYFEMKGIDLGYEPIDQEWNLRLN